MTPNDSQALITTPTALDGSPSDILAVMNYGIRDRNCIRNIFFENVAGSRYRAVLHFTAMTSAPVITVFRHLQK